MTTTTDIAKKYGKSHDDIKAALAAVGFEKGRGVIITIPPDIERKLDAYFLGTSAEEAKPAAAKTSSTSRSIGGVQITTKKAATKVTSSVAKSAAKASSASRSIGGVQIITKKQRTISRPGKAVVAVTVAKEKAKKVTSLVVQSTQPEREYSVIKRRLFNDKLDDSQKEAVKGALFQKPLFLIQGPPGTGKTTVIVEIILQMLADNPRARILVCSQTNLAVDNVLERLPNKKDAGHAPIRKIRLAASKDKVDSEVYKFWFDNRLKAWVDDVINRSKQVTPTVSVGRKGTLGRAMSDALDKAGDNEQKNENVIGKVVKEWQAFLRNDEDCQIRGNVEGGWMSMEDALLKSMNVIGATCVHIAAARYREIFRDSYDCLIMDEASKATPAESLIPILRAKQVVLIGDHKQLPPFVTGERKVWEKVQGDADELKDMGHEDLRRKFGESLFEKLILAFSEQEESMQVMLNTQRRMPRQIGDLISKHFYEGNLRNPDPNDEQFAREKQIDLPFKCQTGLVFIDTSERENRHDDNCVHWRKNKCNAGVVLETLRCLDRRLKEESNFAIIAGYRGQVESLRTEIRKENKKNPFKYLIFKGGDPAVAVNTVDGFQGQEKDIVIYDVVRSSEGGTIGFLDEPRRLNVALSRAKKLLVIVGDADFLSNRATPGEGRKDKEKPILGEIADEIREQGFVFNSLEDALE